MRGGGYTVPPKVTQKNVIPINTITPTYYRIISAGNNAISNAISTTSLNPGFYTYLPGYSTINRIFNTTNGFARSYNIVTINKITGATTSVNYDVFGTHSAASAMASYLTGLSTNLIVIIATYDEPSTSQNTVLQADFITSMKYIGASNSFGSAVGIGTPNGFLYWRNAYILVGSPGLGVGNGIEHRYGASSATTEPGDPNAFIDLKISILNGQYTQVYSNVPP